MTIFFASQRKAKNKICYAVNKEHGGGEIRRRVHILRLKKDENYGIIRYRISGGNHAYLHIHIKRKIWLS